MAGSPLGFPSLEQDVNESQRTRRNGRPSPHLGRWLFNASLGGSACPGPLPSVILVVLTLQSSPPPCLLPPVALNSQRCLQSACMFFIYLSVADLLWSWACPSPTPQGTVGMCHSPKRPPPSCPGSSVCPAQSVKGPSCDDVGDNAIRLH